MTEKREGYKVWKHGFLIPITHDPGKQPGLGMGKKNIKSRVAAGKKKK